jgi:putative restriction endonuclease
VTHQHRLSIGHLTPSHQRRLRWFQEHAGTVTPFPSPVADGELLATRAKGIYKPKGFDYGLSIRVMLSSPYADKAVEHDQDGTWSLQYFQENTDPSMFDREYTNRAMIRCRDDNVPVGVLIQKSLRPVQYEVLGLARVMGWADGFFSLESAQIRP